MKRLNNRKGLERGFTLLQLLITFAIAGIVSVLALISLGQSRDYVRLQSSVRQLAGFMEKARLDSIRRHATSANNGVLTSTTMASVVFTNSSTYTVTMDFDGTGNVGTRTFTLENGVAVCSLGLPSVTFNWRGRISACTVNFALQNSSGRQSWVDVSDAGDVTVNNDVDVLPTVSYSSVSSTGDVYSGTVVTGTAVHNNAVDCGGSGSGGGSGTDTTPITGTGTSGCKLTATPSSLSIKKNGGSTGTVTLSYTGTGTTTVTPSGPINLQVTPTSRTIAGGGSANFSIVSTNTTRSTFAVNFASSCTTVTVAVKITN